MKETEVKTRTSYVIRCCAIAVPALLCSSSSFAQIQASDVQNPKMTEIRRFEERMKSDPIFRQEVEELQQLEENISTLIEEGYKYLFTQKKVAEIRFLEAKKTGEKIDKKYTDILHKNRRTTTADFPLAHIKLLNKDFEGAVKDFQKIILVGKINSGTTNKFPGFTRGYCLQYAYAALMAGASEEAIDAYNHAVTQTINNTVPIPLPPYIINNNRFDRNKLMALIYTADAMFGDSSPFVCDGRQDSLSSIDNYFKAIELQDNDPIIRFYCANKISSFRQYQAAWHAIAPLVNTHNNLPSSLKKPLDNLVLFLKSQLEN
jgi:tetratricopeptide (TPR) repeat protein